MAQERTFLDREPLRENPLAGVIQQEAGPPVQRRTGHRAQQVAHQRSRHLGGEQDRVLAGGDRARFQPGDGALGRLASDHLRRFQRGRRQRRRVPAVALHAVALARDQRAAQGVLGAAFTSDEPVRIRIHRKTLRTAHRGAVGIADARIRFAPSVLAGQGQIQGLVGLHRPGMPEVEIGELRRHPVHVGQPCGFVVLGVAGDGAGLLDRGLQAFLAQIRRAGAALALAEVDGHADAAITGRFDRLDLAQAHVDVQPALLAATDLGLAGATRAGGRQQALRQLGEGIQPGQTVVGGNGDGVQWLILMQCRKPDVPASPVKDVPARRAGTAA